MSGRVVTITNERMNAFIIVADQVFSNSDEVQTVNATARTCTINIRTQITPRSTTLGADTPPAVVPTIRMIVKNSTSKNLEKKANKMGDATNPVIRNLLCNGTHLSKFAITPIHFLILLKILLSHVNLNYFSG